MDAEHLATVVQGVLNELTVGTFRTDILHV